MLEAFAGALHPVFLTGAAVAALAFALSLLLRELPLATSLRREPVAELAAEEAATSAAVGGLTMTPHEEQADWDPPAPPQGSTRTS